MAVCCALENNLHELMFSRSRLPIAMSAAHCNVGCLSAFSVLPECIVSKILRVAAAEPKRIAREFTGKEATPFR